MIPSGLVIKMFSASNSSNCPPPALFCVSFWSWLAQLVFEPFFCLIHVINSAGNACIRGYTRLFVVGGLKLVFSPYWDACAGATPLATDMGSPVFLSSARGCSNTSFVAGFFCFGFLVRSGLVRFKSVGGALYTHIPLTCDLRPGSEGVRLGANSNGKGVFGYTSCHRC